MKKSLSEFISVTLLIAMAFFLAFIIYVWGKDFVTFVLGNSYQNYKNSTIAGSIINSIFRK